jgi:transposase-like protein
MEQLAKQKEIILSRETVRSIMADNDLWKAKTRTGPALHRAWRERRPLFGELIQFDGSYHRWFEDGEEYCLLGAIDDATSRIVRACFDDNEGVQAVFRFWKGYIEAHGLPTALYMDKFSTYKINHKSAVDNEELMTQFQRAMNELGIEVIHANSPEAKGRVERLFGTLQDRLVKEMRLEDIKSRDDANRFLSEEYLPDHNRRFAVEARQVGDAHRPLTPELQRCLSSIFSIQSERQVGNDFTLRFKNQWYQLGVTQEIAVYPKDTVTIEERLDGTVHIRLKESYLSFTAISKLERAIRPRVAPLSKSKSAWKPAADHPWRKNELQKTTPRFSRFH